METQLHIFYCLRQYFPQPYMPRFQKLPTCRNFLLLEATLLPQHCLSFSKTSRFIKISNARGNIFPSHTLWYITSIRIRVRSDFTFRNFSRSRKKWVSHDEVRKHQLQYWTIELHPQSCKEPNSSLNSHFCIWIFNLEAFQILYSYDVGDDLLKVLAMNKYKELKQMIETLWSKWDDETLRRHLSK